MKVLLTNDSGCYERTPINASLPLTYYDEPLDFQVIRQVYPRKESVFSVLASVSNQKQYEKTTVSTVVVPCEIALNNIAEASDFTRLCFTKYICPYIITGGGDYLNLALWARTRIISHGQILAITLVPQNSLLEFLFQPLAEERPLGEWLFYSFNELLAGSLFNEEARRFKKENESEPGRVENERIPLTLPVSCAYPELNPMLYVLLVSVDSFDFVLKSISEEKSLWLSIAEPALAWISVLQSNLPVKRVAQHFVLREFEDSILGSLDFSEEE